ncbi:uncharacterized protein LOC111882400 [Lactuca sativa]|uniref:uncharacterized protein LOC111882400 n=1 Tax=Lactuca sativa TaxID=4236 RepID=UPI000CD94679|nr:uncharacterized protein LOC111882400 [Lactuca sativa]
MNKDLMEKYRNRDRQEKYEVVKFLMACKMKDVEFLSNHVSRMQRYVDRLIKLNVNYDEELAIDIVLNSLPSSYDQFILTYHLNENETTLSQFHNLLQIVEARMKGKGVASTPIATPVVAIGQGSPKLNSACEASKEAIWLKNFIIDVGVVRAIKELMEIFCDNEGAVALMKELSDNGRSRHINR